MKPDNRLRDILRGYSNADIVIGTFVVAGKFTIIVILAAAAIHFIVKFW